MCIWTASSMHCLFHIPRFNYDYLYMFSMTVFKFHPTLLSPSPWIFSFSSINLRTQDLNFRTLPVPELFCNCVSSLHGSIALNVISAPSFVLPGSQTQIFFSTAGTSELAFPEQLQPSSRHYFAASCLGSELLFSCLRLPDLQLLDCAHFFLSPFQVNWQPGSTASCLGRQLTSSFTGASQVALVVKNLPANVGDIEMQVRSLGWEDPLEEGRATHSIMLIGESHGQRRLEGNDP